MGGLTKPCCKECRFRERKNSGRFYNQPAAHLLSHCNSSEIGIELNAVLECLQSISIKVFRDNLFLGVTRSMINVKPLSIKSSFKVFQTILVVWIQYTVLQGSWLLAHIVGDILFPPLIALCPRGDLQVSWYPFWVSGLVLIFLTWRSEPLGTSTLCTVFFLTLCFG